MAGAPASSGAVVSDTRTARRSRLRVTGLQAGVVMAVAAVAAGVFFEVRPPDAYGICMVCHGRDLVNSAVNAVADAGLSVAPVSLVFPVLTVVGVLIGAWVAAVVSGEWRFRPSRTTVRSFVHGVAVMNLGLLAAGCSTRLALRTAAGDLSGAAGFAAMIGGIVLATVWLRRKALS
ncbi:MAG: YeeE/YedE thiosulfate transporter family protein [Acidimicrobiia bacterium]|nr:YeeE/YedE thiosulfate transporter family protein [Acidimicrobiia bacterium]